jgi:hypothetical protein
MVPSDGLFSNAHGSFSIPRFAGDGPHFVALQVAFERQTLKPFFSLDRL